MLTATHAGRPWHGGPPSARSGRSGMPAPGARGRLLPKALVRQLGPAIHLPAIHLHVQLGERCPGGSAFMPRLPGFAVILLGILCLLLAALASPVSVNYADPKTVHCDLTSNVLS